MYNERKKWLENPKFLILLILLRSVKLYKQALKVVLGQAMLLIQKNLIDRELHISIDFVYI